MAEKRRRFSSEEKVRVIHKLPCANSSESAILQVTA
jgi:hypothetical protein